MAVVFVGFFFFLERRKRGGGGGSCDGDHKYYNGARFSIYWNELPAFRGPFKYFHKI